MKKQSQTDIMKRYLDTEKRIVLIADDQEINRLILQEILKGMYTLVFAVDGKDALEKIQRYGDDLSLIVLDLMMPFVTGEEVLSRLQEDPTLAEIPVIVSTSEQDVEEKMLENGASDFIQKPFANPGVVRARIANTIKMHEASRAIDADRYDRVTGLSTMRHLINTVERIKKQVIREGRYDEVAMVYVNVRNFKLYNAAKGLAEGDKRLQDIANILRETFPNSNIGRFSGDHFYVFTQNQDLEKKADRVCDEILVAGSGANLHAKIGIRYITEEDATASVVAICDQAKLAGDSIRDDANQRFCVYDEKLGARIILHNYIVENLDTAIEKGYIQAYCQPVVRSITGSLCGGEMLARWIDPEKGFMSPGDFIPALEDARLIHKLDIAIIEQVCRRYRERMDRGEPVVPVSVNLSRLDFTMVDIVQVILDLCEKYEMPHRMLNIEITESLFADEAEMIGKEIDRFHEKGFQVWMDDFGSGYSSLNILKDYEFDELKIDMAFLSTFNEKSKMVIRSTVRMAKELGIQTLAEGVETEEQYEFLRSIGCEKIQGYYFGKPVHMDEMIYGCMDRGMKIETNAWSNYYDAVGKVNFMSDQSMALIEDNGSEFKYLFANKSFLEVLESNGTENLDIAERDINTQGTPVHNVIRKFADKMAETGESNMITYPSGDQYMQLRGETVAQCNGRRIHRVSLSNITHNSEKEQQEAHVAMMRNVLYLYDVVALLDYSEDTIDYYEDMQGGGRADSTGKAHGIEQATAQFIQEAVFPDDRATFESVTDPATLRDRILASQDGYVADYYRAKQSDGNYGWNIITIMMIPKMEHETYLVVTKKVPFDESDIRSRVLGVLAAEGELRDGRFEADTEILDETNLWKNFQKYSSVKFFWKDKQRRFIGVSQSFLDYYGLDSQEDVIGKTDEDMRWHVADTPYQSDEWKVLREGVQTSEVPGKCIIRGVLHNILASKMPVYKDGKIVGLFGFFVDADSADTTKHRIESMAMVDLTTGVANTRGLVDQFFAYAEEYRNNDVDFAAIRLIVDGYDEFRKEQGVEAGDELLHMIAEILLKNFGTESSIGRLLGSRFVILIKAPEQAALQRMIQQIREDISNITRVGNAACTCFPKFNVRYATGTSDVEEMMTVMLGTRTQD